MHQAWVHQSGAHSQFNLFQFIIGGDDGGQPAVVAMVAAVAEYISGFQIDGSNTIYPGVVDDDGPTFQVFRDGLANTIVGTQRRRKPGVGA